MAVQISPMLAVTDAAAAIVFYQEAFGAEVLWRIGDSEHMVAGLMVEDAPFFLSTESPKFGTRGPAPEGFTTVRIELFVDDPAAAQSRAVRAGATLRSEVQEYNYASAGVRPLGRMLQGSVSDPFGHIWLIGRIFDK